MAKYDTTKFYWLQLKEDFFEDDAISWLEEQEPNGRDYAYFYLKLCLKSLKSNGVLIRKVGNILIPYDNKKLAELTKMDFDTVCIAMELLKKIGLVQILENGEIYMNQLEKLIGSQSIGAFKKQQQIALRKERGGQEVEKIPPKIDIDIELDIDKDIEVEEEKETIFDYYQQEIGQLSSTQFKTLNDYCNYFTDEIIKIAIDKSNNSGAKNFNYMESILIDWKNKGYKTLDDVKNEIKKSNRKISREEFLKDE